MGWLLVMLRLLCGWVIVRCWCLVCFGLWLLELVVWLVGGVLMFGGFVWFVIYILEFDGCVWFVCLLVGLIVGFCCGWIGWDCW